jgi:thiol-disulfide isomerase/thioredoxin
MTNHSILGSCLALFVCTGAVPAQAKPDAQRTFVYQAGQVLRAVERVEHEETDARMGYRRQIAFEVERRYTVLELEKGGQAVVLVQEKHGPQRLLAYELRGKDASESYRNGRFDPRQSVRSRVFVTRFTPTRFRCEASRDEPSVYYLQELPELMAHALQLPEDAAESFTITPELPRLKASFAMRQQGEEYRGLLELGIRDPRVQGGKLLPLEGGTLRWRFDSETRLPGDWDYHLQYLRLPVRRPNVYRLRGELNDLARLGNEELAQLRQDYARFARVRAAFFGGNFANALRLAAAFEKERPSSALLPAVQQASLDFGQQVPRYGKRPPEMRVLSSHGLGVGSKEEALLQQLRGRVVVLDFWATWCKPCVKGMDSLSELQHELAAQGLQVLGVTREDGRQKRADVAEFFARRSKDSAEGPALEYPLLVLEDDSLHDWFGIRAIPKLVVLGRNGSILWEQTGAGGEARLRRIVEAALRPAGEGAGR